MVNTWDMDTYRDFTVIVKGGHGATYLLGDIEPCVEGVRDRTLIVTTLRMWADIIEQQKD